MKSKVKEISEVTVSVVIPVYNREQMIAECINSVLEQTLKDIEIIVVDDCSTDRTVEIVDNISDSRLRKCEKLSKNSGASYARNYGASIARGKYIAFQDSDDIWLSKKLEKQINYLTSNDLDMVFCGMQRINKFQKREYYVPAYDLNEYENMQRQILYRNCVSTQCIMIKKEVFEKIKFSPEIKRYQDWDFTIRATEIARIGYLPEALVISSLQEDSITRTISDFESLNAIYNKYIDLICADKKLNAKFMKKLGDCFYAERDGQAVEFYLKSLKSEFSLRVFVKAIFGYIQGKR